MSIVNFKPSLPNFDFTLASDGTALLCIDYGFGGQLGQFETKSVFQLTYLALLPVSVLPALFLSESILEWKNMMALILVYSSIYLVVRVKKGWGKSVKLEVCTVVKN